MIDERVLQIESYICLIAVSFVMSDGDGGGRGVAVPQPNSIAILVARSDRFNETSAP